MNNLKLKARFHFYNKRQKKKIKKHLKLETSNYKEMSQLVSILKFFFKLQMGNF